jgi:hypothetical protein
MKHSSAHTFSASFSSLAFLRGYFFAEFAEFAALAV